jgi:SHS2 domain-containing protein
MPIPFATAARIDAPSGFPSIPQTAEPLVQEAADGLYEVANALEALNPSDEVTRHYNELLNTMESIFNHLLEYYNESSFVLQSHCIVQICEDTAYEIEALIGAVQIFEEKTLDDVHGIERIGVFYTFGGYSYGQNYNLNLILTRWMKEHWRFPFLTEYEVNEIASRYGFDPIAITRWFHNARKIVWKPLLKLDCYKDKGSFKVS